MDLENRHLKTSEQIFIDIVVQPSYHAHKVLLSWVVPDACTDGDFYIYRSFSGAENDFELLNPDTPVRNTMSYEDEMFFVNNITTDVFYRILMEHEELGERDSPIVRVFDRLTRREFFAVRAMISREYKDMNITGGLPIFYYVPLVSGRTAGEYDAQTGQQIKHQSKINTGYGTPYAGGFSAPFNTFMKITTPLTLMQVDRPDGAGSQEITKIGVKLLPYPKPARGHLIIHPARDDRYVIGEKITGHLFKGVAATIYEVELLLLARDDPRYGVPVPVPNKRRYASRS